jgi:hypothetical protein
MQELRRSSDESGDYSDESGDYLIVLYGFRSRGEELPRSKWCQVAAEFELTSWVYLRAETMYPGNDRQFGTLDF